MNTKQWIEAYEAGHEVESVSMGGISEGYENAIQSLAVEISRRLPDYPEEAIAKETIGVALDEAVGLLNSTHGFSGAQAGGAKNLAWNIWRRGTESFKDVPDRIIKIKKVDDKRAAVVNYQEK